MFNSMQAKNQRIGVIMKNNCNYHHGAVIDLSGVTKSFMTHQGRYDVLKDISLRIERGQMIAITGKSGSGKSTLLNMITGIDKPTRGRVIIDGVEINGLKESRLAAWRGRHIGIVFQFFQLIPTLTVAENVMLPMDFCNTFSGKERRRRAISLLDQVGVADQADKLPAMLSGGQQQRASIARALANDPPILVADEPTGNLDSQNAEAVFELFEALSGKGKTVLVVTHEMAFTGYFHQSAVLSDGVMGLMAPREMNRRRHAAQI
jgi:putative ABC transport system ATP-binding protein